MNDETKHEFDNSGPSILNCGKCGKSYLNLVHHVFSLLLSRVVKPCPDCGSDNLDITASTTEEGTPTAVMCVNCGAIGPWRYRSDDDLRDGEAAWPLVSQGRGKRTRAERSDGADDGPTKFCRI